MILLCMYIEQKNGWGVCFCRHESYHVVVIFQHGITCIGFRDAVEKEKFCHQLDRVVRWLGERADKQKEKVLGRGDRQKKVTEETDSGIQHE